MLMQSEVPGASCTSSKRSPFCFAAVDHLLYMLGLMPFPFPADLSPVKWMAPESIFDNLYTTLSERLVLWHPALEIFFPSVGPNSSACLGCSGTTPWKEDAVFFKLCVVNNVKIPGVSQV